MVLLRQNKWVGYSHQPGRNASLLLVIGPALSVLFIWKPLREQGAAACGQAISGSLLKALQKTMAFGYTFFGKQQGDAVRLLNITASTTTRNADGMEFHRARRALIVATNKQHIMHPAWKPKIIP